MRKSLDRIAIHLDLTIALDSWIKGVCWKRRCKGRADARREARAAYDEAVYSIAAHYDTTTRRVREVTGIQVSELQDEASASIAEWLGVR